MTYVRELGPQRLSKRTATQKRSRLLLALVAPTFASWTRPVIAASGGATGVTWFDLGILISVAACLARLALRRRDLRLERNGTLVILVGAYGLLTFSHSGSSLLAFIDFAGLALGIAGFCLYRRILLFGRRSWFRELTLGWLLMMALNVGIGVSQLATNGRAFGLSRYANELGATALAGVIVFGDPVGFEGKRSPRTAFLGLVLSIAALILSGSRGAAVGVAAYAVVTAFVRFRRRPALVMICASAILFGLYGFESLVPTRATPVALVRLHEAIADPQLAQVEFSLDNFHRGWERFVDSPISGAGVDHARVSSESLPGSFEVHNIYLQILAAQGLLGFGVVAAMLWKCWKTAARSLVGVAPTLVSLGVAGLVVYDLKSRVLWLAVAWAVARVTIRLGSAGEVLGSERTALTSDGAAAAG